MEQEVLVFYCATGLLPLMLLVLSSSQYLSEPSSPVLTMHLLLFTATVVPQR